jgi:hypothetical protein
MYALARSYADAGDFKQSLDMHEAALSKRMTKLGPEASDTLLSMLRVSQLRKDQVMCLEALGKWDALERSQSVSPSDAAAFRSACAGILRETDKSPAGQARANQEANRAMALLQQAVSKGYTSAQVKQDKDLDPLRDRDDFKKLITDLEAKTAAEKK